ncbi:MAG: patatin-like phospholipase family protein [Bacteroidales bacterium]|nr:patatin-like phospholipase family protein [Bacteroidales bacterium]MCF8391652.1 patatin-like phospholipase family protein [Bacteroidales bacterium]
MKKFSLILLTFLLVLPVSNSCYSQEVSKPKIGLVLSGGGAKGLAHVGVLRVLEEAGIRPDYVGGTSMGAIVGALYAVGYSVDSIEKIALSNDWFYFLTDEISRLDLAIEEKEDADRFFVSVPINESKIQMPTGVITGQNIHNKLNTLYSPVYDLRDFNEFEIPFLSIATDIETGKEVVFREGYLPDAIRASMSIPTIFNPIEIDGKLLVDGGLVNNFPVIRVKEMGADFIIGVDVGFQHYKKEELNSIVKVLEQSVFFYGEQLNSLNKKECDILIKPELGNLSISSFGAADSLIKLGESAARKELFELQKLALLSNGNSGEKSPRSLPKIDSLVVKDIRINGLNKVSENLVLGKLQLEVNDKVLPHDIERAVERLYSSLYFENIEYELVKDEQGLIININVKETQGGQFRLGLHYDSNYRASILLNATFRNFLLDGSKLSGSVNLGENPFFDASFFKNNGGKPGFGISFNSSRLDAFVFENGRKISSLSFTDTRLSIYTQSTFWNSYALGAGLEYEGVFLKPKINPLLDLSQSSGEYLNYYGFIKMDSYDNAYYPKRGIKYDSQLKFVTNSERQTILFLVGRFSQAYNVSPKITLINHFYGGAVDGDSIPYQYNFYMGGINPVNRNGLLPFVGLDYMERVEKNAIIWAADFQYEILPDIYAIAKINIGNFQHNFKDLLQTEDLTGGYGLTLGYDSYIGPIEISVQKGVRKAGFLSFINIGFWF